MHAEPKPLPQLAPGDRDAPPLPEPPSTRPLWHRFAWPQTALTDPLWTAALAADTRRASSNTLPSAWWALAHGHLRLWCESIGLDRAYVLARVNGRLTAERFALSPAEAAIALPTLCGDLQKVVATELRISPSTASARFRRALEKLGMASGPAPLPLVLAAQTWAGVVQPLEGRSALFEYQGCPCVVASVPRPVTAGFESLSRAQQEVARLLIEGHSRHEIARRRSTSPNTVASQIHRIFTELDVRGRNALVRRACELGCFGKQPDA